MSFNGVTMKVKTYSPVHCQNAIKSLPDMDSREKQFPYESTLGLHWWLDHPVSHVMFDHVH